MKRITVISLFAVVLFGAPLAMAASGAGSAFDQLKALAGQWNASTPEGSVKVTYDVVSNGSALMERMEGMKESMVTMYHMDGENLMLTHYCGAGNQPRMRADFSGGNAGVIPFTMFDATNMGTPDAGHMHKLVVTMKDKDHFSEQWTFVNQGKEQTSVFDFQRVK